MLVATYRLVDMHCHLDFMSNAAQVAQDALSMGLAIFDTCVTPDGYEQAAQALGEAPNVRVGVGLHPWWIADGRCNEEAIERAARRARESRFVGEIGLDFSPAHADPATFSQQRHAFEKVTRSCAEGAEEYGAKVLSIHSVRSAADVLDALELTGCLRRCRCIFHWFSGSSDELHRAAKAGCWFSINEMMLRTRRGREYARQIPDGRLLVETDLPPKEGEPFAAEEIASSLERTLAKLEEIRGKDVHELVVENAMALLG